MRGTSRRKDVPVAIPRTPPSFFCNAATVDIVNALVTVSGASARARSSAVRRRRWRVSLSSKHTFSISYVHPPGPGELPEGALDKHCENATGSSTTGVGLLAITSGGISRTCSCGLRRCNSANVSNVPGANVAPVKACLAHDTWPCFTRLHAASPRLFCSASWVESLLRITPILLLQVDWQSSSNKSAH